MALDRRVSSAVVAALGLIAAGVPLFDTSEDVFRQNQSLVSAVIENLPLFVLSLSIVAVGVWLVRSDWDATYIQTVAKLATANVVGVTLLVVLVVLVQLTLQNNLKPFIIAADVVVIGAIGGLLLGLRTAQQRQATDEAAAQRDRFQALFDNVPNPIVGVEFIGDDPIVRAVNPAFTEVFGFDRRTIVGESLEAYIVPADETLEPVDQPMTTEEVASAEAWDKNVINLETVDGQREFIRLTAPVERGPARDSYGIYIDVTVQRQRRERLRVLSRALRHDIRNQLSIIRPSAAWLADRLDGEEAERARAIETAADTVLDLSEQTRRVEQQIASDSEATARNLTALVEDAADVVREAYDCTITVEAPPEAYGSTTEAFTMACEAIMENGVVHNDRDDPTVEVTIVESLDGAYYDVRIADDGPGIPDDQRDVISGASEATQTEHLEGLGLWTARWVIQNSGGELQFAANSPRGTIVTIRIPQASTTADDAAVETAT